MNTRHTSYILIVVVVSALAPWRGAAWPQETDLEPIPVQGRLSPDGRFDGTLMVKAVTVADVNAAFRKAADGELKGILQYTEEELVSSDFIGGSW